jgi:hypothetical protein
MIVESPGPIRNGRMPGRATGALPDHPAGREAGTDRLGSVIRSRSTADPTIGECYRRFLARFFLIGLLDFLAAALCRHLVRDRVPGRLPVVRAVVLRFASLAKWLTADKRCRQAGCNCPASAG